MNEYINDERLLDLTIPIIDRILKKYLKENNDQNTINQIITFLFKCLDKHKRKASVLFLNLDIENERVGILKQLVSCYFDVFDFNFIDSKSLSKSSTFLLNELQKLKIEMASKISEMEAETQKQKNFYIEAQKIFNDLKIDLLKSNRSLGEKVTELERKLERYTKVKVREIEIATDPKFQGSKVKLTALVKPEMAFNDGVEWTVNEDVGGTVRIESKNEREIVLKFLLPNKVTVIATALDGSGVTAIKEFNSMLKVRIEINVQQNHTIKGRIEVAEDGFVKLDTENSRYLLNTNGSSNLGLNAYQFASKLDTKTKDVSFIKQRGDYYLHTLVVDNQGSWKEFVSQVLHTEGGQFCFEST